MSETIGNSKCQCIMPFDKRHILKALEESIERQDEEIKKIQEKAKEIRETELLEPEELMGIYERIKRDLQIVWKRTENTPSCKNDTR